MDRIGQDCKDIIMDYKYELEHIDNYKHVLYGIIYRIKKITIGSLKCIQYIQPYDDKREVVITRCCFGLIGSKCYIQNRPSHYPIFPPL